MSEPQQIVGIFSSCYSGLLKFNSLWRKQIFFILMLNFHLRPFHVMSRSFLRFYPTIFLCLCFIIFFVFHQWFPNLYFMSSNDHFLFDDLSQCDIYLGISKWDIDIKKTLISSCYKRKFVTSNKQELTNGCKNLAKWLFIATSMAKLNVYLVQIFY